MVLSEPNTSILHGICIEAPMVFMNVVACLYNNLKRWGTFTLISIFLNKDCTLCNSVVGSFPFLFIFCKYKKN